MKKLSVIVALLLTFSLMLGMASCQPTATTAPVTDPVADPETEPSAEPEETAPVKQVEDPIDILSRIDRGIYAETPISLNLEAKLIVEQENMTLRIPLVMALKSIPNEKLSAYFLLDKIAYTQEIEAYYEGEALYINVNGERIKMDMAVLLSQLPEELLIVLEQKPATPEEWIALFIDDEDISEEDREKYMQLMNMISELAQDIRAKIAPHFSVTEDGDTVVIRFEMSKEDMLTFFTDLLRAIPAYFYEAFGDDEDTDYEELRTTLESSISQIEDAFSTIDFDPIALTFTIERGILRHLSFDWKFDNIPFGDTGVCTLTLDADLSMTAIGDDVVIETPDDLDEYVPYEEYSSFGDYDTDEFNYFPDENPLAQS